jgi:hypothetical protein
MAQSPSPSDSISAERPQSLSDRVRARVTEVGLTLDERARAARPKAQRPRKSSRVPTLLTASSQAPELAREARSLRRVFTEFGDAHRQYRLRTGQHTSPALREAAQTFKRAPSLTSLVAVAAFLDEDGLLEW